MSWNYRVFKKPQPKSIATLPWIYFVGECYYTADGLTDAYSESYHGLLSATNLADLKGTYDMVGEAFTKPVLVLNEEGDIIQEVQERA